MITYPAASVVVVGGGPAGLAAADAALRRGVRVTLIEGAEQLGGQYWRHSYEGERSLELEQADRRLQHGWSKFTHLRDRLSADPRCSIITSGQVWAIEAGPPIGIHLLIGPPDGTDRQPLRLSADVVVFATGAHDRTLPFPGWDLPGVFTAGAAQAMVKAEGLSLGRRVLVAGSGPFLLPAAASLTASGASVVGVFEASPLSRLLRGWLPRPWQLTASVGKLSELTGYLGGHLSQRIPYRVGQAVIGADGDDRVTAVTLARVDPDWAPIAGTEHSIAVDTVVVSHGFSPRLELPIAAGAVVRDGFVRVDDQQQTSAPGVYAAGEITGIAGADAALAEGVIAGHCAAGGELLDAEIRIERRRRAAARAFASRLEAAHGVGPGWRKWLTEDTVICRCEEVPYGRMARIAEATPDAGLRSLKLTTRACLGLCQGRICGRTVEELLGRGGSSDHRPIAAPLRLAELANQDQRIDTDDDRRI